MILLMINEPAVTAPPAQPSVQIALQVTVNGQVYMLPLGNV